MEFIVRILFTGMMVFIPNNDGTQLDVVLLNVGHGHAISDGTTLAQHKPLLITRAGSCTGTCPTGDAEIAAYLFGDKSTDAAVDSLEAAVSGGGAWQLSGSQISVVKGSETDPDLPALDFIEGVRNGIIPTTSEERADYSWLAKMSELCPGCGLDSDILATPPPGLVAARFRLQSGDVFTYSIARIGSNVTPVHFKRLDGTGSASSYTQAIAVWMGADIAVSGDSIKIVESKFDNSTGRTMTLTPDEDDRVEIAVLNLPPLVPASPIATPGVGKHFQAFYEVAETVPSAATRLVPLPGAAPGAPSYSRVTWQSIHPQEELWSELLNALRLNVSRSEAEISLCPPVDVP
ncbi:MAG TPA: hypothetical protein VNA69_04450 [Thermoanaerobaculia bacterium]|nr:hypothetical protein [Thermoanaerobaculia bacterium]